MSMPPIRPGWLTRLANRLGLRRHDLVAAVIATILGAPVAATVVLLATVPVPQATHTPFDPAPATTIATTSPVAEPALSPQAALTVPRTAPRVVLVTETPRPSRTRTAPPRTTAAPAPATTAPPTSAAPSTSPAPETSTTSVEDSSTATR